MAGETIQPKDRATAFIEGVLGDGQTLEALTGDGSLRDQALKIASGIIRGFTGQEKTKLVGIILNGLGRNDEVWTQNKHDAALEILGSVGLEGVDKEALLDDYLKSLKTLSTISDPIENIDCFLDASELIASRLPSGEETVRKIADAWSGVLNNFKGGVREFIEEGVIDILKEIEISGQESSENVNEQVELAEQIAPFEDYIDRLMASGSIRFSRNLEKLIFLGDWSDLFDHIVKHRYPHIAVALGSNWSLYSKFVEEAGFEEGAVFSEQIEGYLAERYALRDHLVPEEQLEYDEDEIRDEAERLGSFLKILEEMMANGVTVQDALNFLKKR